MQKMVIILSIIVLFLVSCQGSSKVDDYKNISGDFASLDTRFMEKEAGIKTSKEYQEHKALMKKEFEQLFEKYRNSAKSNAIDTVKSRILLRAGNPDGALAIAEEVIASGGDDIAEAKMVKVQALLGSERVDEAYRIFNEIESDIKPNEDLYNAWISFAFEASDKNVRKLYTQKLVDTAELPDQFKGYRHMFHANLASIAKEEKDVEGAREILKNAIGIIDDPRGKKSLESELSQIELLGKKAPPINAEAWINSPALSLDSLKGKVVVIDFWAPWCSPCRDVIPGLIEEYEKQKDNGLVVIGFAKLYGSYRDDVQNAGTVDREKEIELIKGFMDRYKIVYPVAISDEGKDFDSYMITGIPTMIFIDRNGLVDHIKVGSGNHAFVKDKIEELLKGN